MSNLLINAIITLSIFGAVVDKTNDNPIVGAHVVLSSHGKNVAETVTDMDGAFAFESLNPGIYVLTVTHLSYETFTDTVKLEDRNIKLMVRMVPTAIVMPPIDVQASRVTETDAIPFTEISRDIIGKLYTDEEPPVLFDRAPGVFSFSEDGLGLSNTHLNIRGFPSNRISVLINGIPVNDPESHTVYWVDYPDILSDAAEIQVQRGVGASLYGVSSFGGLVNVQTFDFSRSRFVSAYMGYGSFNTRKFSIRFSSGAVGNWAFYARYSKVYTDGWRERSWLNSWSYYIGAEHFTDKTSTKLLVWGGPENLHYSYWGITKEEFEENPRYNPITYENEIDNFYQPHYELFHTRQLSENLTATFTLFYVHGKGYCEQYRWDQDFSDYLLPDKIDTVGIDSLGNPIVDTITSSDLVRRRWVNERDIGFNSQLSWKTPKTEVEFGFGGMHHRGRHWGEVVWAAIWPDPDVSTLHRYYDFMMDRPFVWGFVSIRHDLGPFAVLGDLSVQHRSYKFYNDRRDNITFDVPYTFLIPRIGVSKVFNDNLSAYFSVAHSSREPSARNIYDATHPYESAPLIDADGRPLIKPEKLTDLEAGLSFKTQHGSVELTLYRMDFRDELVPNGGLTDEGYPRVGNAASSLHQGVEVEARLAPFKWLKLTFSGHKSIDKVNEMTIYTPAGDSMLPVTYRDKVIPGFPQEKFSAIAEFTLPRLSAWVEFLYRGKLYVDLDNRDDLAVEPHLLINIGAETNVGHNLSAGVKVVNIANKPYLQYGVYDVEWHEAYYFPAAPMRYFAYLKATF